MSFLYHFKLILLFLLFIMNLMVKKFAICFDKCTFVEPWSIYKSYMTLFDQRKSNHY